VIRLDLAILWNGAVADERRAAEGREIDGCAAAISRAWICP
jgi:hypothetical protein